MPNDDDRAGTPAGVFGAELRFYRTRAGGHRGPGHGAALVRAGLNPIQTRTSGSTGFCLDIPEAQATPGLQMQTWRCNGTRAQQFWVLQ